MACATITITDIPYTCDPAINCPSPNTCVDNVCTPFIPPEAILVAGAFVAPDTVVVNEQFVVSQVVINEGTVDGTATVTFTVGGETKIVQATIPAGGSAVTLSATFTAIIEGALNVTGSLDGVITGSEIISVILSDSSSLGIFAIVGIALIGGFILMSGKSKPTMISDSGGLPIQRTGD
jgi:hypothetical protein